MITRNINTGNIKVRNKNLTAIHKFYFLEYFDILLKSIQFSREPNIAFTHFIGLKDKKKLAELKKQNAKLQK